MVSAKITRRELIAGGAMVAASLGLGDRARASGRPPNILVLVSDDQAYPFHGFMRNEMVWPNDTCNLMDTFPYPRTPFMDHLAENGIVFHQGHVTISDCNKSRASFWSGRQRRELANTRFASVVPFSPGLASIPFTLSQLGYMTCGVGKHQIGSNTWLSMATENRRLTKLFGARDSIAAANRGDFSFLERLVADAAAAGRPWFFAFCPVVPHQPYYHPHEPAYDYSTANLDAFYQVCGPGTTITAAAIRHYLGSCTWWSELVHQIFDRLVPHGFDRNTLILFTSDHGASLDLSKGTMSESGLRQPILAYFKAGPDSLHPSIPGTGLNDALVSAIDLFPTILDAAGVPPAEWPDFADSRSFLPLAQNPTPAATAGFREFLFSNRDSGGERQVTDGTYKLWASRTGAPHRFHCLRGDGVSPADPFEKRNILSRLTTEQRARMLEMRDALNAWWAAG